jgi:hypothetical protein
MRLRKDGREIAEARRADSARGGKINLRLSTIKIYGRKTLRKKK